jgi:hypothetical protein
MSSNWRVPIGFALAPLIPCALVVGILSALSGHYDGALFFFSAMVVVSLAVTLIMGVPLYLVLRHYWRVRLLECLGSGALAAILLNIFIHLFRIFAFADTHYSAGDSGGATFLDSRITRHGVEEAIRDGLIQTLLGISIGFCFWVLAIWRNRVVGSEGISAAPNNRWRGP